jgi:hypothetical protein
LVHKELPPPPPWMKDASHVLTNAVLTTKCKAAAFQHFVAKIFIDVCC